MVQGYKWYEDKKTFNEILVQVNEGHDWYDDSDSNEKNQKNLF